MVLTRLAWDIPLAAPDQLFAVNLFIVLTFIFTPVFAYIIQQASTLTKLTRNPCIISPPTARRGEVLTQMLKYAYAEGVGN